MSESGQLAEYRPDWPSRDPGAARVPEDGWHLLAIVVRDFTFENVGHEKPYANVSVEVTSPAYQGLKFMFRLYLHAACEWRVRFFLGKFEYPKELLTADPPVIRRSGIIGLEGQVMVLVTSEGGVKDFDIQAFGHLSDPELERRYAKQRRQAQVEEEAVDIHEDVRQADAAPAMREPGDEPGQYIASDEDLPENLWPEGDSQNKPTAVEGDEWPD